MKTWRLGMFGYLPMAGLAMLMALAFSGCEGTTNQDSSGVDAYLAAHPYTSAPRDTPLSPILQISPLQAIVNIVGQTIAFTASGGDGAFHWGVSDSIEGKIESKDSGSALYTCLKVANNDVIVQDDSGH